MITKEKESFELDDDEETSIQIPLRHRSPKITVKALLANALENTQDLTVEEALINHVEDKDCRSESERVKEILASRKESDKSLALSISKTEIESDICEPIPCLNTYDIESEPIELGTEMVTNSPCLSK